MSNPNPSPDKKPDPLDRLALNVGAAVERHTRSMRSSMSRTARDLRSGMTKESFARSRENLRHSLVLSAPEKRQLAISAIAFAVLWCIPFVDNGYWLSLAVSIAMYTVLATSWALFSGPTNYISLGTAAFFGIGMYVVAGGVGILPYWLLVVLAGVAGVISAAIVGLATLRIAGVYFVIFTLGMAELIRQVMVWAQSAMGSQAGLYVLIGMADSTLYWLLLSLCGACFLIGWWIGRSRLGFALRIIGNDEVVAVHSGINTARAKVVLFVISSTFASITGAFVAPRYSYVEPTLAFSAFISFQVVIMALLGGLHRLWGPLVGVIPFTFIWELINASAPRLSTLLLGVAFLLIVYVIPHGFVGVIEDTQRPNTRVGWAWQWLMQHTPLGALSRRKSSNG